MVAQQPILKFNEYTVKEYILILSEHQSTHFVSPDILDLWQE